MRYTYSTRKGKSQSNSIYVCNLKMCSDLLLVSSIKQKNDDTVAQKPTSLTVCSPSKWTYRTYGMRRYLYVQVKWQKHTKVWGSNTYRHMHTGLWGAKNGRWHSKSVCICQRKEAKRVCIHTQLSKKQWSSCGRWRTDLHGAGGKISRETDREQTHLYLHEEAIAGRQFVRQEKMADSVPVGWQQRRDDAGAHRGRWGDCTRAAAGRGPRRVAQGDGSHLGL